MKKILLALSLASALAAQEPTPPATVADSPAGPLPEATPAEIQAATTDSTPPPALPPEDAIPQVIPPSRYESVMGRNPFLIKTTAPVGPTTSFAENYELKGYFSVKGIETVTLMDRSTNKRVKVTTSANADGLKLVRSQVSAKRKDTSFEISKGAETATFTFPSTTGAGPSAMGGIAGGNPTVPQNLTRPGMPSPVAAGAAPSPRRALIPTPTTTGGTQQPGGPGRRVIPGQIPGQSTPATPSYSNPAQQSTQPYQNPAQTMSNPAQAAPSYSNPAQTNATNTQRPGSFPSLATPGMIPNIPVRAAGGVIPSAGPTDSNVPSPNPVGRRRRLIPPTGMPDQPQPNSPQ